ncbi:MAG: cytochrome c oxidase assembly protein [Pseudomonadales bacterium]|nr:cytochrome c oxidase assembly protein [Pseudomonadales bacterium]
MTIETNSQTVFGHRRTIKWLLILAVGMFGFGFAMVPLYKLVCSVTGWNSIDSNSAQASTADISQEIDLDRTVTVTFDGTINAGLPWEFKPLVRKLEVTPGKSYKADFYVKNYSNREIVGQAIPGITPWQGTEHFHKTECFCFTQQTLAAGESRVMPLRFTVDARLPKEIKFLTLSYTLMDTDRSALKANAGLVKH